MNIDISSDNSSHTDKIQPHSESAVAGCRDTTKQKNKKNKRRRGNMIVSVSDNKRTTIQLSDKKNEAQQLRRTTRYVICSALQI
jgi:hypothetical protein